MASKWWRCSTHVVVIALVGVLYTFGGIKTTQAIKFEIDKEECFSYNCPYKGENLRLSFVVTNSDTPWRYTHDGVDLVITAPSGEKIYEFRDKTSEKFEFMIHNRGVYRFCFSNKSPYYETVDFNVDVESYIHVGYFRLHDDDNDGHAKDEHFSPLLEQILKLKESLDNIQFEQHWLEAQTNRQAKLNEYMSKRAIAKATLESLSLIAASLLQVFLLKNLFERKLGLPKKLSSFLGLPLSP